MGDLMLCLSKQQAEDNTYAVALVGAARGMPAAATVEETVRGLAQFGAWSSECSASSLRTAFALLLPRWTNGVLAAALVQREVSFHAEGGAVRIHCPLDLEKLSQSYPSMAELIGYLAQV